MICSLIRIQAFKRCVAYLSIEQLGAIEGETRRRERGGGRLSHLTILGKIRTPRKEGEEEYLVGYRVATCRPSEVEIRLRPRDACAHTSSCDAGQNLRRSGLIS